MAQNKINKKTFYLYDYSNKLATRAKKIYSPYNVKTYSTRNPLEDTFENPDFVEFKNWMYVAERERLWDEKFEQQVEWLGFYNPRWGILTKWNSNQLHLNWQFKKNDWAHIVKTEKIHTWPEVQIKTVTEKVEIQQIPELIAKNMDVKQLQDLANTWEVILPDNILELWDSEVIKNKIISLLKENWNIN